MCRGLCGARAGFAAHDAGALLRAAAAQRSAARQAQSPLLPQLGIQPPPGAQLGLTWSDFEYESADSQPDSPFSSSATISSASGSTTGSAIGSAADSSNDSGPSGLHADAAGIIISRNPRAGAPC